MNKHVLIVDDEPDLLELLGMTLTRMGLSVDKAGTVKTATSKLASHHYDLCLTDMRLPDGDGIDVIKFGQKHCPNLPIAMITAHGDIDTAIDALKLGAFDFLNKPVDITRLKKLIAIALKSSNIDPVITKRTLLGNTESINALRDTIKKVARNQAPVFIRGESGSGKELVARMVHDLSARNDGPFIPINCGAIPSELMESEFFGHKKGAFTGAHSDKVGLFEAANGGILFLDEIADLPLAMQVKLLRAIQEKKVRPVGSPVEINVDIRLVSATHKDLSALVTSGVFRADLFFRLNVIEIRVPPLRQRKQDIPLIVSHILERLGKGKIFIHPDAQQAIASHDYPGNIRELENILERAVAMCDGNTIYAEDLLIESAFLPTVNLSAGLTTDVQRNKPEQRMFEPKPIKTAAGDFCAPELTQNTSGESYVDLEDYLVKVETQLITEALEACRWNKTAAAKDLA